MAFVDSNSPRHIYRPYSRYGTTSSSVVSMVFNRYFSKLMFMFSFLVACSDTKEKCTIQNKSVDKSGNIDDHDNSQHCSNSNRDTAIQTALARLNGKEREFEVFKVLTKIFNQDSFIVIDMGEYSFEDVAFHENHKKYGTASVASHKNLTFEFNSYIGQGGYKMAFEVNNKDHPDDAPLILKIWYHGAVPGGGFSPSGPSLFEGNLSLVRDFCLQSYIDFLVEKWKVSPPPDVERQREREVRGKQKERGKVERGQKRGKSWGIDSKEPSASSVKGEYIANDNSDSAKLDRDIKSKLVSLFPRSRIVMFREEDSASEAVSHDYIFGILEPKLFDFGKPSDPGPSVAAFLEWVDRNYGLKAKDFQGGYLEPSGYQEHSNGYQEQDSSHSSSALTSLTKDLPRPSPSRPFILSDLLEGALNRDPNHGVSSQKLKASAKAMKTCMVEMENRFKKFKVNGKKVDGTKSGLMHLTKVSEE